MPEKIKTEKTMDRYKICPTCGNFCHIDEKQIYCILCGDLMIDECLKCKAPITYPTAKYCAKCGVKFLRNDLT